jgi:hypothetical protein
MRDMMRETKKIQQQGGEGGDDGGKRGSYKLCIISVCFFITAHSLFFLVQEPLANNTPLCSAPSFILL